MTVPSANFCVLTRHASTKGAIEKIMSCCLFRVSLCRDSYTSKEAGYAWSLVNRIDLLRITLITLLSRYAQISPHKNVSFPCTNAAFTLPPEPMGFAMCGWLAQRLSIVCGFCPPDQVRGRLHSHGCAPACFRLLLAETPLPSARTSVSIHHYYEYFKVLVQGTFTP